MVSLALDHVQPAMPPSREAEARAFYGGRLGLPERDEPAHLAGRAARLAAADHPSTTDQPLDGYDRLYVYDPFGNRVEPMQRRTRLSAPPGARSRSA